MGKSAARHSGKEAMIVRLAPDVCLAPIGSSMVPVPYMIISRLDWSESTIPNVTFGGEEAFTMASRTNKVTGNEAGTGGGVKSGVNKGWCRPISNKSSFFIDGRELLQHTSLCDMNCAGTEWPGNTVGKLRYVE